MFGDENQNVIICRGVNSEFLNCTGTKLEREFYDSWSIWDGNKTCYCKDCLAKIYDSYLAETKSDKIALYYTCMQANIPFIKNIYDIIKSKSLKTISKTPLTFNKYMAEFLKNKTKKKTWNDFSKSDFFLEQEEKNTMRLLNQDTTTQLENKWGIQDDERDYIFLEDTFERYTNDVSFVNPQQEDLYKDLCRDRLLLRKINDNRYSGEETIDKVQNRIAKTMSILKVDQFESKKVKTLSEQTLFEKIRLCDKNNVEDVYSKPTKLYDLNKIQYYNEKFSLRPLANMLVGTRDFSVSLDDIEQYELK